LKSETYFSTCEVWDAFLMCLRNIE
jgi:hypothetical protein